MRRQKRWDMKVIETTTLSIAQRLALMELWNNEYPIKLKYEHLSEFEEYLDKLKNQKHFLLLDDLDGVCGWAFGFERDEENWFAILVDSSLHNNGFGTQLLSALKKNYLVLNGWVIDHNLDVKWNGDTYKSPLEFYLKSGFRLLNSIRLQTEKISAVKIVWAKNVGD